MAHPCLQVNLQTWAVHSLLEPHWLLFVFAKSRGLKVKLWMLFLDMNSLRNLLPPAAPRHEQVLKETSAFLLQVWVPGCSACLLKPAGPAGGLWVFGFVKSLSYFRFCLFSLRALVMTQWALETEQDWEGRKGSEEMTVQERERVSGIKLPPISEAQQFIRGFHGGFKQLGLKKLPSQNSISSNVISTVPSFDLFSKVADNAPINSSAFVFYLILTLRLQWRKDSKQWEQQLYPLFPAVQGICDKRDSAGLQEQAKQTMKERITRLQALWALLGWRHQSMGSEPACLCFLAQPSAPWGCWLSGALLKWSPTWQISVQLGKMSPKWSHLD